jgi:Zn-dependent protease
MDFGATIVGLVVLVLSVILHEVAHGYAANWLGDPTARLAGRLTLNPIPHIDLFGSIILPLVLGLSGSPILFGYAKPVPYNPYNLKGRWGEGFVAAAGALTNFALAIALGLLIRFMGAGLSPEFVGVLGVAVYLNLLLGIFNLIPIPPLDGSKVLASLLSGTLAYRYRELQERFEALGPGIGFAVVVLVFYLFQPVFYGALTSLFSILVGGSLLHM